MIWPILILAFANVCSFADRQLTSILAQPIRVSLGLDASHMALLGGTAFAVLYGVAGIPAGLASDRFRRRNLICMAILFWSAATAFCGIASSFGMLFIGRLGVGLGEAVLLPCAFSLIRDLAPPDRQGWAFTLFGLGIPAGSALGLIVGGVLNTYLSAHPHTLSLFGSLFAWQKTFLLVAGLGVPAAGAALFLPEPPRHVGLSALAPDKSPLKLAPIGAFLLAVAAAGIIIQGVSFWLPSLMMARLGMSTAQVGLRLGLTTVVAATLGLFVIGTTSDRLSHRLGLRGAALTLTLTMAGFIPAAALVAFLPGAGPWAGAALFYFLAIGFTPVASALTLRVGPALSPGLMGAIYGLVVNVVGHGVGPVAYGFARDRLKEPFSLILFGVTAAIAVVAVGAALSLGEVVGRELPRRANQSAARSRSSSIE